MRKPGSWRRSVLLGATGLVVLAGAYLLGFVTSDEGLFPSAHLLDVKYQLRRLLDASSPGLASSEINTALLRIAISSVQVDGDAELRGGGITPLGRDLLGVTGSGEFFL